MSTCTILRGVSCKVVCPAMEALEHRQRQPGVIGATVRLAGYQHSLYTRRALEFERAGADPARVRVGTHGALEARQRMRHGPRATRLHAKALVEQCVPCQDPVARHSLVELVEDVGPA